MYCFGVLLAFMGFVISPGFPAASRCRPPSARPGIALMIAAADLLTWEAKLDRHGPELFESWRFVASSRADRPRLWTSLSLSRLRQGACQLGVMGGALGSPRTIGFATIKHIEEKAMRHKRISSALQTPFCSAPRLLFGGSADPRRRHADCSLRQQDQACRAHPVR